MGKQTESLWKTDTQSLWESLETVSILKLTDYSKTDTQTDTHGKLIVSTRKLTFYLSRLPSLQTVS